MAGYTTIESILCENHLSTYFPLFQEAQLTDNELQFVEDSHLKEMGIPLGPRLKICSALRARGYTNSARPPKPIALNNKGRPPELRNGPVASSFPPRPPDVGMAFPQPQRSNSENSALPPSFGHPSQRSLPETSIGPPLLNNTPFSSVSSGPQFGQTIQPPFVSAQRTSSHGVETCSCYKVPCVCSRSFSAPGASNLGSILEFSAFSRPGGSSSVFSPFPSSVSAPSQNPLPTLFSSVSSGGFPSTYSQFPSPSDPWNEQPWQVPASQTPSQEQQQHEERVRQEQQQQQQQQLFQQEQQRQQQEHQKQEHQKQEQQKQEQQRQGQQRQEQQRQQELQRREQAAKPPQPPEEKPKPMAAAVEDKDKFVAIQPKNVEKKKLEETPKLSVQESKPVKKEKEQPSLPAPTVFTGNAFDLLNNESDDEQGDKSTVKGANGDVASKKKDNKTKEVKKTSSISVPATTTATPTPPPTPVVPIPAPVSNKPKCECGQIVHPSVLNPITEFQMQDRQAHLTSKRHQTYLVQQEALAKKEKEAKLKQEKADAQKAKEDAQKAKEEAQKAIEEAQKVIEEAQKAEEAEAEAQKFKDGGGKKKNVKKPKKKEKKLEEVSIDRNNSKTTAKDADLKRKKQLASEMQQEANQLYNQGLYAKAVDRYTDGINLNPTSAVLYSNRAQAETKCHQYERAVSDCLKAIELDPGFAKSYHRASACFVKLGDLAKAKTMLAMCKSACIGTAGNDKKDETPFHVKLVEDLETALTSVKKFMQDKAYKEAIDLLQNKITSQMPEASSAHYLLAEAYIMTGNFNAAHDVAHKFMIKCPHLADTRILESLFAYYNEAKLEKAADILKSVLAEDKDNSKASKLLDKIQKIDILKKTAEELHLRKNYPKAAHGFGQALSIDRDNKHMTATLLCLRGGVFFNMGQFSDAKRDLDESVELWNTFLRARKLRASVNEKLGNNQAVVDDCRFILDEEWDARTNEMMKAAKQSKPAQDFKGYYAALAIPLDANMEDITRSYKKLALRWNPDKWSGNTEDKRAEAEMQFRAIAVAYEVLSDPAKRTKYDNCDGEGKIKCDCGRHNVECYIDLR